MGNCINKSDISISSNNMHNNSSFALIQNSKLQNFMKTNSMNTNNEMNNIIDMKENTLKINNSMKTNEIVEIKVNKDSDTLDTNDTNSNIDINTKGSNCNSNINNEINESVSNNQINLIEMNKIYRLSQTNVINGIDSIDKTHEITEMKTIQSIDRIHDLSHNQDVIMSINIINAMYNDLQCKKTINNYIQNNTNNDLQTIGGIHHYLINKPFPIIKTLQLSYNYQSNPMKWVYKSSISFSNQRNIHIIALWPSQIIILSAFINEMDITDDITLLINHNNELIIDILDHIHKYNLDNVKDFEYIIDFQYQTRTWDIMCHGSDDLLIPCFDSKAFSSSNTTSGIDLDLISGIHKVTNHSLICDVTKEIESSSSKYLPITIHPETPSSDNIPMMMKGYINMKLQDNTHTVWRNRYFILQSNDDLPGLLSYYAKSIAKPPYGKDIRGCIQLHHYYLDIEDETSDMIIFHRLKNITNDENEVNSLILEIKDQSYRQKWLHSIKSHHDYCHLFYSHTTDSRSKMF